MARSVRLQWAGAHYHVMALGNRRQRIFCNDDARRFFLAALGDAGGRIHFLLGLRRARSKAKAPVKIR
jgi:putative transposase